MTPERSRAPQLLPMRDREKLLNNHHVTLIDPMPEHYPALFQIARSAAVVDRWQAGSQSYGYEAFVQRFWEDVLAQFIFASTDDTLIPGLVRCEQANFRHQTAHIAIYAAEPVQMTPLPIMALATFIDFVFSTYPLRKLYAEVPEFNFPQFASGEGSFFEVEGRLIEHEVHFGALWDMLILSLSRGRWEEVARPIVQRWRGSARGA